MTATKNTIHQVRDRVARITLTGIGVGALLEGLLLLLQAARSHHLTPGLSASIAGFQALGTVALLRRRAGYEAELRPVLWALLVMCTYVQSVAGLTPVSLFGDMTFVLAMALLRGARTVPQSLLHVVLALCAAFAAGAAKVVPAWHPSLHDPRQWLVWLRSASALLWFGGATASACAVMIEGMRDASRRVNDLLQNERWERTQREASARALAAAERFDAIGRLANGVGQDFDDCLNFVATSARSIRSETGASHSVRDLADAIVDRAQLTAARTRELSRLGRTDPGQPSRLRLETTVRRALSELHKALGDELGLQITGASHAIVAIDAQRLVQALANLARFARETGGSGATWTLEITEQRIAQVPPGWAAQPGEFAILACTFGPADGRPADELDHIFEPFAGQHSTTAPLGLATVRRTILDAHGFIEINTRPERPTTLRLLLPILDRESEPSDPPARSADRRASEPSKISVS